MRLLFEIADGRAFCEPGFAGIFLILTGNDAQHGRLTGAVRTEDTDLGIRVEDR
jgi:hypothetical protein